MNSIFDAFFTTKAHGTGLGLPIARTIIETYGGAMLLGVDGLCLISHGSSSATAIVNAVRVAKELHDAGIVERLRTAVAPV